MDPALVIIKLWSQTLKAISRRGSYEVLLVIGSGTNEGKGCDSRYAWWEHLGKDFRLSMRRGFDPFPCGCSSDGGEEEKQESVSPSAHLIEVFCKCVCLVFERARHVQRKESCKVFETKWLNGVLREKPAAVTEKRLLAEAFHCTRCFMARGGTLTSAHVLWKGLPGDYQTSLLLHIVCVCFFVLAQFITRLTSRDNFHSIGALRGWHAPVLLTCRHVLLWRGRHRCNFYSGSGTVAS